MERKTALATAAAITMGVSSALFAVGAGTGVFGSAAASGPTPAVQAASIAANSTATNSTATNPSAASTATSGRHSDDQAPTSSNQSTSRGESND
jgi:hypothetical protein